MRLIDADVLKEMFRDTSVFVKGVRCGKGVLSAIEKATNEYIRKVIDECPTIEAEPVRHGKWINAYDTSGGSFYKCSECACYIDKTFFANDYAVDYCPNCGAKMDKEVAENAVD